ncbi:hypothetical protein TeGR_g1496 [Tetraparma gracilis]|uniref:Uncharacterized protein n=1 Tax=Tetraparma gracilis TaxID=2962635 RepID=A0ABQ6MZU1_9STRA|nr:hypothetical protein TeGR_g1496 [Tetraparma gracilis]
MVPSAVWQAHVLPCLLLPDVQALLAASKASTRHVLAGLEDYQGGAVPLQDLTFPAMACKCGVFLTPFFFDEDEESPVWCPECSLRLMCLEEQATKLYDDVRGEELGYTPGEVAALLRGGLVVFGLEPMLSHVYGHLMVLADEAGEDVWAAEQAEMERVYETRRRIEKFEASERGEATSPDSEDSDVASGAGSSAGGSGGPPPPAPGGGSSKLPAFAVPRACVNLHSQGGDAEFVVVSELQGGMVKVEPAGGGAATQVMAGDISRAVVPNANDGVLVIKGGERGHLDLSHQGALATEGTLVCIDRSDAIFKDANGDFKIVDMADIVKVNWGELGEFEREAILEKMRAASGASDNDMDMSSDEEVDRGPAPWAGAPRDARATFDCVSWDLKMRRISKVEDEAYRLYLCAESVSAFPAKLVLERMEDGLHRVDIEPDCVGAWQAFACDFVDDEEKYFELPEAERGIHPREAYRMANIRSPEGDATENTGYASA